MSTITISGGQIDTYQGEETALDMRIYCRRQFTTSGGSLIERGSPNTDVFYKSIPCTVDGEGIIRYNSFTIDSTEDGIPNSSYYTFALYTTGGTFVGTAYKRIVVPVSPSSTTMLLLATYNNAECADLPNTYYTARVIDQLFEALVNMARKATDVIFGAVRLSAPAYQQDDPIVVAEYDPVWRGITETVYLESYGHSQSGLNAAISAIGATQTELRVTKQVSVTADTTVPANILVSCEGDGSFNVASTKTLTINSFREHPPVRVFYGSGNAILGKNAASEFHVSWWAGRTTNGTDDSHAFQQAFDSCKLAGVLGGRVQVGVGDWYVKNLTLPVNIHFNGCGAGTDANYAGREGTRLCLASGGSYVLRVHSTTPDAQHFPRFIRVSNMYISMEEFGTETSNCVYYGGHGGVDGSSYMTEWDFVGMRGSDIRAVPNQILFYANGQEVSAANWESIGNRLTNCFFIQPYHGEIMRIDTVNSSWHMEQCTANGTSGPTGIAYNFLRCGWVTIINPDSRGYPDYTVTNTVDESFASVTITTGDGVVWADDHVHSLLTINTGRNLTKNDVGKQILIPSQEAGFPGGAYITSILPTDLSTYGAKQALLSWHPTALDYSNYVAVAADMAVWGEPANISGTVFRTYNDSVSLTIIGGADEGFLNSFDMGTANYATKVSVQGYTAQGKVKFHDSIQFHHQNCQFFSLAFENLCPVGPVPIVWGGSHVYVRSVIQYVYLDYGKLWGKQQTEIEPYINNTYQYIDNYAADPLDPTYSVTHPIFSDAPLNLRAFQFPTPTAYRKPLLSIGHNSSYSGTDSSLDQVLLELGQQDPNLGTLAPLLVKYWFSHHKYDGALELQGNQPTASLLRLKVPLNGQKILCVDPSNAAYGVGYGTGAGGQVTQTSGDRSAGVTLNKQVGSIAVPGGTSLAAGATVTFRCTNSCVRLQDHVFVHIINSTNGQSQPFILAQDDGWFDVQVRNFSATADTYPMNIGFVVIKGEFA